MGWWATSVLGALLATRQFEKAQRVLDLAGPVWSGRADPAWRTRELQIRCQRGQFSEAEALVDGWGGWSTLTQHASPAAAGLLATRQRWSDLIAFLADRLDRDMDIDDALLLEAVAQATRRTGRHDEVIDLLSRAPSSRTITQARDALNVEASVLNLVGLRPNPPEIPVSDPFLAERLNRYTRALQGEVARTLESVQIPTLPVNGTVVWCSDLAYLLGTCVSVSSLLRHDPELRPSGGYRVVVDRPGLELAREALGQLSRASGVTIDVIDAKDLLPDTHRLRSAYGLFTPGHTLSEAAYYRVFAARAMAGESHDGRIIYLDSDTCIGPGLGGAFFVNLDGHPLAARSEHQQRGSRSRDFASVDRAARSLGLNPNAYFNSGVLAFDRSHPNLIPGLDRTIAVALHEPERLTFHDQCALNLGFAGDVALLPETFNQFLRPDQKGDTPSPVVLHYIQRPKPWDTRYPWRHGRRWLEEFDVLSAMIESDTLARLVAPSVT